MIRTPVALACVFLVVPTATGQTDSLTAERGQEVFSEASALSGRDEGRLWGRPLYGPMLLVDPETRRIVANRAAEGLESAGAVSIGVLPDSVGIANTATTWAGVRWTMLMWPLPEDSFDRRALIAHELWHRVQGELGFPSVEAPNLHLGTRDGRVLLQLEWRALAAALAAEGDDVRTHLANALAFHDRRMQIFPDAPDEERRLLLHEGLAQYTGYALSGRTPQENRLRAVREIGRMADAPTFVRSFAYPTGAAYGLLLDVVEPEWRSSLTAPADLTDLAGRAIGYRVPDRLDEFVSERLSLYDGVAVMAVEDSLLAEREERLTLYRSRFVDGPTLELPFFRMSVQFDPSRVDALDDLGKVYPSLRLTDEWGVLTVDGGALIAADWSRVVVPAPQEESDGGFVGDGYVLQLAEGWALAAGPRRGDRVVWRPPDLAIEEVSFRTSDGVTVFGDLYRVHPRTSPLILLFHQGASNARAEYLPIAQRLIDAGYNLLAIDQRRGGDRFGGENRTVTGTLGSEYSYCDCYADMEAALRYVRREVNPERIIAWGSSYSAALVFRLAVDHPDAIDRLLAFSPATGEPMAGCMPEPWAAEVAVPALVVRPAREMELAQVSTQFETFASMGHQMYVADPGTHGSSTLNPNRVTGDVEPVWKVVLGFLTPEE